MNPAANVHRAVSVPRRMLEILEKITKGQGTMEDLDKSGRTVLAHLKSNSLCALGADSTEPGTLHPALLQR